MDDIPEKIMAELIKPNFKTAELGHTFSHQELEIQCKGVHGGVSWPGKRPGFAVVIAMDSAKHLDSHDIYLLDEYESFRIRELVRQCGVLDYKYAPAMWIGDDKNGAADRFIDEMNKDLKLPDSTHKQRRCFSLTSTSLLDMERPYPYILDTLKELLNSGQERRQLILKDSKVMRYLAEIEEADVAELELGSYPAIEALAFAVIEMRDRGGKGFMTKEEWRRLKQEHGYS